MQERLCELSKMQDLLVVKIEVLRQDLAVIDEFEMTVNSH